MWSIFVLLIFPFYMKFLAPNHYNCYSVVVSIFVYYQHRALFQAFLPSKFPRSFMPKYGEKGLRTTKVDTKVKLLGVFLVHIFLHSDWIRTRKIPNAASFPAVLGGEKTRTGGKKVAPNNVPLRLLYPVNHSRNGHHHHHYHHQNHYHLMSRHME